MPKAKVSKKAPKGMHMMKGMPMKDSEMKKKMGKMKYGK